MRGLLLLPDGDLIDELLSFGCVIAESNELEVPDLTLSRLVPL